MPKIIDTDRLFRTVVQLFAERGYEGTTTQELARLANVNEATLYRRFGSKPNLVTKALHHCLAQSPFANLTAGDDAYTDLMAIVTAYEKTFQAFGGAVMTLMIEMSRHDELQAASAALMPNFMNAAQIIGSHQTNGTLKPGSPAQLLTFLIAPMMVSGMMGRSRTAMNTPAISPQQIVEGFLCGYRTGS
jgi:AcrR family transcriptional regulator